MRCALLVLLLFFSAPAAGQEIRIGFVSQPRPVVQPVSPLDPLMADEGLAGSKLAIADNETTGRFTGQTFSLVPRTMSPADDPATVARDFARQGIRFLVADLDAPALLALASSPAADGLIFFNIRAPDDALRGKSCRANLLHTIPSRAMLADGLAQYLAARKWRRWFLLVGRQPGDRLMAEAYRRAARRFGAEIVAESEWRFVPGHARTDTGHVTLQSEIPVATRAPDHDVLVVADESGEFGDFLPGRTALPRVVAGTQGLKATGFDVVSEQWGASQLQSRFLRLAGRRMGAVDYAAWLAVRAIGEAATRSRSADPETIAAYLRGEEFLLSGFKGQGLSFRDWDGQMRQPILIAGPRLLVSASPQPGYLHRGSELDTLGVDREESECAL